MNSLEDLVKYYQLEPHPEGGYYREIYRSPTTLEGDIFPQKFTSERNLATSIYYLLSSDSVSHLHRLKSDEIWYFHHGRALEIHMFSPADNTYHKIVLGSDINTGEQMQVIIPAGTIFGAQLMDSQGYCLIGCLVAPGFNFDDFTLITRQQMLELFPKMEKIIKLLTK